MTQPNPVLPERAPASEKDPIFAPFSDPQSYLNLLYLLLAFPLGIAYFVFVVTGLSLSVGLLIVWVGIPLLLGLLAASIGLASFERLLARQLLGVEIRGARNGPLRLRAASGAGSEPSSAALMPGWRWSTCFSSSSWGSCRLRCW